MPDRSVVYVDSCGFIDAVKQAVGKLPTGRDDDVWHIKKLMEAHRAGDVLVVTSFLTPAECVAIEPGQSIVPPEIQEQFRRLLDSGQYVALLQQTPRTAQISQDLRWRHNLVLAGPRCLALRGSNRGRRQRVHHYRRKIEKRQGRGGNSRARRDRASGSQWRRNELLAHQLSSGRITRCLKVVIGMMIAISHDAALKPPAN